MSNFGYLRDDEDVPSSESESEGHIIALWRKGLA
jgi:hypothetical protein